MIHVDFFLLAPLLWGWVLMLVFLLAVRFPLVCVSPEPEDKNKEDEEKNDVEQEKLEKELVRKKYELKRIELEYQKKPIAEKFKEMLKYMERLVRLPNHVISMLIQYLIYLALGVATGVAVLAIWNVLLLQGFEGDDVFAFSAIAMELICAKWSLHLFFLPYVKWRKLKNKEIYGGEFITFYDKIDLILRGTLAWIFALLLFLIVVLFSYFRGRLFLTLYAEESWAYLFFWILFLMGIVIPYTIAYLVECVIFPQWERIKRSREAEKLLELREKYIEIEKELTKLPIEEEKELLELKLKRRKKRNSSFWRNFIKRIRRDGLYAILLFILLSFPPAVSAKTTKNLVVITIDRSGSIKEQEWKQYKKAVMNICKDIKPNTTLILLSFGTYVDNVKTLQSPSHAGLGKAFIKKFLKNEVFPLVHEIFKAPPTHKNTDFALLFATLDLMIPDGEYKEKKIYILTDGFLSYKKFDFQYGNLDEEKVNKLLQIFPVFKFLKDAEVYMMGLGGVLKPKYEKPKTLEEAIKETRKVQLIRQFWERYFVKCQAKKIVVSSVLP